MTNDEIFMKKALAQAKLAQKHDEIPIGAVIVDADGKVIARGRKNRNHSRDATEHAEIVAIRRACKRIGDWRLNRSVMFVTLEPCAMCVGACVNARLKRIVFGAYDVAAGCCASVTDLTQLFKLNHTTVAEGGVLMQECSTILSDYFKQKRTVKNAAITEK